MLRSLVAGDGAPITNGSSGDPTCHDLLLFDLDGTLCDPIEGITRCINHSLVRHGHEAVEEGAVARFIGPPLNEAFESILGTRSAAEVDRLIESYRERYSEVGYTECHLYPGIAEVLRRLAERQVPLAVCTSKRGDFAERILERFELRELFRFVDGGEIRIPKAAQLARLRSAGRVTERSVMIGDRAVELVAARVNRVHAAGVLWGYGARAELEAEAPRYLFSETAQMDRLHGAPAPKLQPHSPGTR